MKVLIYSAAHFSDNTLPLYKAMKAKGVDVTLLFELGNANVCLFNEVKMIPRKGIFKAIDYPSFRRYEKYCNLDDVYVENCPGIRHRELGMLASTLRVIKFIRKGNFDVIHIDFLPILWKAPLLIFFKKMTLIQHEAIPHARKLDYITKLFRKIEYHIIPKIVILNNSLYEQFCQRYNLNNSHVLVNKLGPLDCIKVFVDDNKPYDSKKFVFWGRIVEYKGLEYLCQAMPIVHEKVPDAKLVIAGGGEFYFNIEPYKSLSYIKIVNKYLDMEDLAAEIADCAFTICPYVSSSQSGGVITSLVLGKPVIGTNFDTMKEMLEDEVTGLLVPPRDVDALAAAIIRLLEDIPLQQRMMKNIKTQNDADKSWSQIADKYLEFYKKRV